MADEEKKSNKSKKKKLTGIEKNEALAGGSPLGKASALGALIKAINNAAGMFDSDTKEQVTRARKRAKTQSRRQNLLDSDIPPMPPPFALPSDVGFENPDRVKDIISPGWRKKKNRKKSGGSVSRGRGMGAALRGGGMVTKG
tara:strand:- start:1783 stop:2208 length:426 start_codon:yes stop_codon:yes gene_type:complete